MNNVQEHKDMLVKLNEEAHRRKNIELVVYKHGVSSNDEEFELDLGMIKNVSYCSAYEVSEIISTYKYILDSTFQGLKHEKYYVVSIDISNPKDNVYVPHNEEYKVKWVVNVDTLSDDEQIACTHH